jgi:cardiolipin synthase
MMHNKVMVVDGIWSTIGSINLDNLSMRRNAEVNVAIYDRGFARSMEEMIEGDRPGPDINGPGGTARMPA